MIKKRAIGFEVILGLLLLSGILLIFYSDNNSITGYYVYGPSVNCNSPVTGDWIIDGLGQIHHPGLIVAGTDDLY